jgi:hypothetical protein
MLRNLLINWFQMALFADPFANDLASPLPMKLTLHSVGPRLAAP